MADSRPLKKQYLGDIYLTSTPSTSAQGSKGGSGDLRACTNCGVTQTPQWREGPLGPRTLCNACGVKRVRQLNKLRDSHQPGSTKGPKPQALPSKAAAAAPTSWQAGAAHGGQAGSRVQPSRGSSQGAAVHSGLYNQGLEKAASAATAHYNQLVGSSSSKAAAAPPPRSRASHAAAQEQREARASLEEQCQAAGFSMKQLPTHQLVQLMTLWEQSENAREAVSEAAASVTNAAQILGAQQSAAANSRSAATEAARELYDITMCMEQEHPLHQMVSSTEDDPSSLLSPPSSSTHHHDYTLPPAQQDVEQHNQQQQQQQEDLQHAELLELHEPGGGAALAGEEQGGAPEGGQLRAGGGDRGGAGSCRRGGSGRQPGRGV